MSYPFDPFAETAQLQKTECRNGMSYKDLGQTSYNVFQNSLGNQATSLQEADLAPWEAVGGKAASIIDLPDSEQGTVEISAKLFAKALYTQYILERDLVPDWDNVQDNERIAWEAVGRHLANLIDSDGATLDFNDMEARAVSWSQSRLQTA